jgi:8-oxo-dGTP pyrophosphatase MutT (NUDIX family)
MKLDLTVAWYLFNDNRLLLIHHNKLDKWLPVWWHIDPNETPDYALIREFKEETNLDIKILNIPKIKIEGSIIENLATPFYVNTHNVWDHNHCWFYYICKAKNIDNIKIKKDEISNYKFFTKDEIYSSKEINTDVKNQCLMAFREVKK